MESMTVGNAVSWRRKMYIQSSAGVPWIGPRHRRSRLVQDRRSLPDLFLGAEPTTSKRVNNVWKAVQEGPSSQTTFLDINCPDREPRDRHELGINSSDLKKPEGGGLLARP